MILKLRTISNGAALLYFAESWHDVDMKEVRILKDGGIGVLPTDTLYGIVGSAFSKKAVGRIYEIKGRNEKKPFIILIDSVSKLRSFGISLSKEQLSFIDSVWPGPVSVVLPCPQKKFEYLHRGTKTLAFRMPKNKTLRDFLKKTGPLVAPSANPEGAAPAKTIAEAKKYFGKDSDFYIAGGRKAGRSSKIISLTASVPIVIRE